MNMGRGPCSHFEDCRSHWAKPRALWGPPACKGELPGPGLGAERTTRGTNAPVSPRLAGSPGWLATCRAEARVNPNPVRCCRAQSNLATLGEQQTTIPSRPTSPTHPESIYVQIITPHDPFLPRPDRTVGIFPSSRQDAVLTRPHLS